MLKSNGAASRIEYKAPKTIFESVKIFIKVGKIVFKSIMDIVKDRKTLCQVKMKYNMTLLELFFFSTSNKIDQSFSFNTLSHFSIKLFRNCSSFFITSREYLK